MYNKSKLLAFVAPFILLIGLASVFVYQTLEAFHIFNHQMEKNFLIFIMVIAPIMITTTLVVGIDHWNRENAALHAFSTMWLVMIMYLTMMSVIMWIIAFLFSIFGIEFPMVTVWFLCMVIIYILVFSGIYRAAHPKVRHVTIASSVLAPMWKNKKIVLISDVHIGMVRKESFVGKLVEKINEIDPDIVFIAGDLIDGPRFPYDIFLAPLGKIKSKLGIYYTPGNHEGYNNQNDLFYAAIPKNITLLRDKVVLINNTQIVGIDFGMENAQKTAARFEKFEYRETEPSIALFHDPRNMRALVDKKINLVLSGHTHGGQFFPNTLVTWALYGKLHRGLSKTKDTLIYVSVGVGTALSPVRIGTTPEIVVIKITDEK